MTLALKARRKFVFIDGTITKPTTKRTLLNWDIVNSMLVSWILRSMDSKLTYTLPYFEDAKLFWDYLAKRFSVANGPRLQQIWAAITACRQTKTMSVDDYYNKLMGLFDELSRLKTLHYFTCGKCTCHVAGRFAVDRNEEKFHQFLVGIDDELYGFVRSNLLSRDPIASLDEAYNTLIQEENSRSIALGKIEKHHVHAFALQADRPRPLIDHVDRLKLVCTHCLQSGHEVGSCFKLHGYPEWWEESNQRSRAAVVQGRTAAPPARVAPFARRQPAAPERAHVVMGTKAAPTINSIVPVSDVGNTEASLANLKRD
ncbi:hypothetical protein LIER_42720 [Lithospermum erythrorhizon]|uniref:Retrotransposon gag domain-containing protein n=1 Tax=Lithospermum erythrorhizon TaxID=34254 RepID=A0AAV3NXA6_LITER